jgi:hypothetical protein
MYRRQSERQAGQSLPAGGRGGGGRERRAERGLQMSLTRSRRGVPQGQRCGERRAATYLVQNKAQRGGIRPFAAAEVVPAGHSFRHREHRPIQGETACSGGHNTVLRLAGVPAWWTMPEFSRELRGRGDSAEWALSASRLLLGGPGWGSETAHDITQGSPASRNRPAPALAEGAAGACQQRVPTRSADALVASPQRPGIISPTSPSLHPPPLPLLEPGHLQTSGSNTLSRAPVSAQHTPSRGWPQPWLLQQGRSLEAAASSLLRSSTTTSWRTPPAAKSSESSNSASSAAAAADAAAPAAPAGWLLLSPRPPGASPAAASAAASAGRAWPWAGAAAAAGASGTGNCEQDGLGWPAQAGAGCC